MKMNVVKQVSVDVKIDSKDIGVAFAVAPSDEQVSFIESVIKEFNSWVSSMRICSFQEYAMEYCRVNTSKR